MKVRKAVIPAAGLGTRFLPATKAQPKEMLPIVDKPTIQYIIEEAVDSGIEEILILTGRNKEYIENHFDKSIELEMQLERSGKLKELDIVRKISSMADIHYIRQKEPKGLGDAVSCAKSFVGNEPFAVMLGDDVIDSEVPCLKQLMNCFNEYKTSILGVQKVNENDVMKYGIIKGLYIKENVYKVKVLIEKPTIDEALSNIAILGRYIITPQIFEVLNNVKPGKNGEIQLTDALQQLISIEAMYACEFVGNRYDVGDNLGLLQANIEFALKRGDLREKLVKYIKMCKL